jgi:uncharacterized protein involved in type VI secretion and phage assembly
MSLSLIDTLGTGRQQGCGLTCGVVIGIVTNNQDSAKMGRVRVSFPWLSDDNESWWAHIAAPMAGNGRGVYFLPEVGDQVLVAFAHGDMRSPYIVGALWSGKDAPPATNDDGQNNIREIKSRNGSIIRFDDTDGKEKIEILDKTGSNSLTIATSDNSITLTCNGRMKLQATGIDISSQEDINIEAQTTMNVTSHATMQISSDTTMDIKAPTMININ